MRFPWSYSKRVVAGAIFGLYMAHLLYYLNPQIDITPSRLIAVTLVYGVICGLIFGSILWGFRLLRIRLFGRQSIGPRPHGFGFVVTAAFLSAFVYLVHLEMLRIYLPRGAIRILSKATTVIAVTAALLLVLWLIERTAERRASRILFSTGVALIVISSFFLYERREGYRSDVRAPVVATVAVTEGVRPAVFAAVRDLPYDWIVTLRGEGALPFLGGATDAGFFARIEPFRTTSPKAVWASLNTGKLPNRHGVTGRFSYQTPLNRPDEPFLLVPMGVGFKGWGLIPPVDRISAHLPSGRALPFWDAWRRLGLTASVFGWNDGARQAQRIGDAGGRGIDAALARLPDPQARAIRSALGEDRARVERAIAAVRGSSSLVAVDLRVLAATLDATGVTENDLPPRHTPAGDVVRAVLALLDGWLEELATARNGVLFAAASPSAAEPPTLPGTIPGLARAAEEAQDPGADDGFLLLLGDGTAHRENPPGIAVVDVVPTLLFGQGLPIGRDMDGRVVTEAFTDAHLATHPISLIQTYETDRLVVRRVPSP